MVRKKGAGKNMDKSTSISTNRSEERNKSRRVCPSCGKEYTARPALSRKDGKTEICPDCGMREALEAFGFNSNKIEKSISEIHKQQGPKITREYGEKIKAEYPEGTKIELVHMVDPYAVEDATVGEVDYVDDIGSIHMKWENGRTLALIPGVDEFNKI